jgi:hypothetical protein
MFCFADQYYVETWKNGICNRYKIELSYGEAPYNITEHVQKERGGHGTLISTMVELHIPDYEQIKEILSVRFLYDPRFTVRINGNKIELLEHRGIIFNENIKLLQSYAS